MKYYLSLVIMACSLFLCGCPPHREYHIFNGTGVDLELISEHGAIAWPDQKSISGDAGELFIFTKLDDKYFVPVLTVKKMGQLLEYGLSPIPDEYIVNDRGYRSYFQIDSHQMIWILKPPTEYIVDLSDIPQPDGYPIKPLTNKEEQLRLMIRDPEFRKK